MSQKKTEVNVTPEWPARRKKLIRTPTLLQMEASECGAAALGIVLGYYQRYVPLEELRTICGVSRDGSKAINIIKAARQFGLDAKGQNKDLADLTGLKLPIIVFWGFNHFLVVEGFGPKQVFLNDPGRGRCTVGLDEFNMAFTGVVLTFVTTDRFSTGGKRPTLISGLRKRLSGSRFTLLYAVLATLALVVPDLIVSVFPRVYVDDILVGGKQVWMEPLLAMMAAVLIVQGFVIYLQQLSFLKIETKLSFSSSSRFFWHILRMPQEFFAQRFSGEIGSRIEINDRVAALLSGDLATNTVNLILIVFYGGLMFFYDRPLTLLAIAIACTNLVVLRAVSRRRIDSNHKLLQMKGKLVGVSAAGLKGIESLKSIGAESDFFAEWAGEHGVVINTEQSLGVSSLILSAIPPMLTSFNFIVILAVGGIRVMNGFLTMGMLIAFQTLVGSFMQPVTGILGLGGKLQEAQGDLARLDDVLNYPEDRSLERPEQTAATDRKLRGVVELKEISFGYSRLAPPLVKNFSLTLQPGQRIALVGGSGSGKSTVAKLLAGLYLPWSGEILVDGQPLSTIPRAVLSASLAMVDQSIFMFEGTVRENLTLWDDSVPERTIVDAAKDAEIHDMIMGRTGGYDSRVEEGARNMSGGERQRLEIARALISNPTILILDEATSALDSNLERKIDDHIRRRGCACLIVAHRLSTVRDCDEIIVMQFGTVVERGRHDELIRKDGFYAKLVKST
jgi:NHLM bacteriocin system ABC transporter peptidase/ATP-binding protein